MWSVWMFRVRLWTMVFIQIWGKNIRKWVYMLHFARQSECFWRCLSCKCMCTEFVPVIQTFTQWPVKQLHIPSTVHLMTWPVSLCVSVKEPTCGYLAFLLRFYNPIKGVHVDLWPLKLNKISLGFMPSWTLWTRDGCDVMRIGSD